MKRILNSLCDYLGHKINATKTNIYFFDGVSEALGGRVGSFIGF